MTTAVAVKTKQILVLVTNGDANKEEKLNHLIQSRLSNSTQLEGELELQMCEVGEDLSVTEQEELVSIVQQSFDGVYMSTNINAPYLMSRLAFIYGMFIGSDGMMEVPLFGLLDEANNKIISVGNTEMF